MPILPIKPAIDPTQCSEETPAIVRLWLLRLLRHCLAQGYIQDRSRHPDWSEVLLALGDKDCHQDTDETPRLLVIRKTVDRHSPSEVDWGQAPRPEPLSSNLLRINETLSLDAVESQLFEFCVYVAGEPILQAALSNLPRVKPRAYYRVLEALLGISAAKIETALHYSAKLRKSGLLAGFDPTHLSDMGERLAIASPLWVHDLERTTFSVTQLLSTSVSIPEAPHLNLRHFAHLQSWIDILLPLLRSAKNNCRMGVNVLLHGAPGTGKTQLARLVAQSIGTSCYEVISGEQTHDESSAVSRVNAYQLAQSFLTPGHDLLVFDEIEDVFASRGLISRSEFATRKALVNQILESNRIPALWLSNSIQDLDPAFIRRFDLVLEVPVPPRVVREQILRHQCGDNLTADALKRLADHPALAPATVVRAAQVVQAVAAERPDTELGDKLERIINNTLRAQGHASLNRSGQGRLPCGYSPDWVQADADLAAIANGLRESRSARLCMFGPSGSGKTAYGHWLAQELEMPLQIHRASDLLSPYVGVAERNIAKAFDQATNDEALLLIDEVDSFLQDRQQAHRSWEVTLVNEMLTRMEDFHGIFVASTNLMAGIDRAALRRFDIKIQFDYLGPQASASLLSMLCTELELAPPTPDDVTVVGRLRSLTPGDFAAMRRQHRFRRFANGSAIVQGLVKECALKDGANASIGFV